MATGNEMMTIPPIIWSGVVGALGGAFVALTTTVINNRWQNKRQEQQLAHDRDQRTRQLQNDAEQRSRQLQHDVDQRSSQFEHDTEQRRTDREMSLRREVYLEAIVAIGKMQEFLASYSRQDVSENERSAMTQGTTASLNKVHIVGTNRTVEAFYGVQRVFAKNIIRLGKIKLDVVERTIDIEQAQRHQNSLEKERESLSQRIQAFSMLQQAAVDYIGQELKDIDAKLNAISDDLDEGQHKLFALQMELIKVSTEASIEMMNAIAEAALAVREDMRMGLDVAAYRAFIKEQQEAAGKEFGEFIAYVEEKAENEKG